MTDEYRGDPIHAEARRLLALFESYDKAYGTYDAGVRNEIKGKVEIKSSARTLRAPVTALLWESHLRGDASLGLIPIRDNDTCLWGCIDVDVYGISHKDILENLKDLGLPLVVCRSKSGGAHIYLFMAEPVPASRMQKFLRDIAVLIGHGASEVFPKQGTVNLKRGDLGSWLNMPYFGGDETDRFALNSDGMGLTTEQFLDLAESLRQPARFLDQTNEDFLSRQEDRPGRQPASRSHPDFGDGPPCMQHLSVTGFPEGTRNKGLFALAVFAKKKFGNRWKSVLEEWNRTLFDPPLDSGEVQEIIRQHERKDYYYTCKESPIAAHCNSAVCRTRRFGVGGDDDFPIISGLSVLDTDPPLWFLDVEDHRLELTTDELQNYRRFHSVCMEQLFKCYRMMKQDQWLTILSEAMRNAVKIEAPSEVGRVGHFYQLLEEFLTDRYRGEMREDLLMGRPIEEDGRYYFRLSDLMKFLENANFRMYTRSQVSTRLRRIGGGDKFFNIKSRGTNVFYVPVAEVERMPTLSTPDLEEDRL